MNRLYIKAKRNCICSEYGSPTGTLNGNSDLNATAVATAMKEDHESPELYTTPAKYKQEIHQLRLKLQCSELMEKEMLEELASLKEMSNQEKSQLTKQMDTERKWHTASIKHLTEQVESLRLDLLAETKKCEGMKLKLKLELKAELEMCQKVEDTSRADSLQVTVRSLEECLKQVTNDASLLAAEHTKLLETEQTLNHTVQSLEVNLQAKKDEVHHLEETLMVMQVDLSMAKLELGKFKTDPSSHLSKGNSLFGEVEDRRQRVEKRMSKMQDKYQYMEHMYMKKCEEVSILRCEKVKLCSEWEEIKEETKHQKQQFKAAYGYQIKELTNQHQRLKEPLVRVVSEVSSLKWMQTILEERNDTIESLHRQLTEKSFAHLLSLELIRETEHDLACCKADHKLSQAEFTSLQLQISHMTGDVLNNPDPSADLSKSESKATSKMPHFTDTNKEKECREDVEHKEAEMTGNVASGAAETGYTNKNDTRPKVVQFSASVPCEPEKMRVKLERCKQRSYPIIYIPSSKKPN